MATKSKAPILKSLRQRIAVMFVVLSSLVYITLTVLGMFLFKTMMIKAVDNELRLLASSLGHAIDVKDGKPYFRNWLRVVETEPSRSVAVIQLYDLQGRLLEHYGPKGYPKLLQQKRTIQTPKGRMRVITTPLVDNNITVGYMQLELPEAGADEATRQFGLTMAMISPLVIAGLAATSIVVSGQVARPFIENMNMLRRFVGDAGHELNTPLAIVQGRVESLGKRLSKQGIATTDLESIERSLGRMAKIVRDLSLLTEVEGPLASSPKSIVDLGDLVEKIVEDFKERFQERQIALHYQGESVVLAAYPDAVQRLVTNLLENALRYTEPGGNVDVTLTRGDRSVQLNVADTGIGIPAENLAQVFDRFYRIDKSRSRASGGVGLGLSIVKAIAEAHGGGVSVASEVGKGSKFKVSLPIS